MMEFLTEITTIVPEGTDEAELERKIAAEGVRARELAATVRVRSARRGQSC